MDRYIELMTPNDLIGATIENYSLEIYSGDFVLNTDKGQFFLTTESENELTYYKRIDLYSPKAFDAVEYGVISPEEYDAVNIDRSNWYKRNMLAEMKIRKSNLEEEIKMLEAEIG